MYFSGNCQYSKIETLMDDICLNVPLAVFKYHEVKSQINDPNSVDFFFTRVTILLVF